MLSSAINTYVPGNGVASGVIETASSTVVASALRTDLGIGFSDVVAQGMIDVAADPAAAFLKFKVSRRNSEKAAADRFAAALQLAADLGLPQNDAVAWAKEQASDALSADLQLLRLRYPFSDNFAHAQQFKMTGQVAGKKDSA